MVIVGQGNGEAYGPSLETSSDSTEMDVYSKFFKKWKFSLLLSLDTININIITYSHQNKYCTCCMMILHFHES